MLQTIFLYLFCQWSFLQYNSYYLITCRREVLVLLGRGGQESAQQGVGGVWRDLWSQRHRGRLPGHRWGHRDHDLHQKRSDSGIKSIYLCVKIPDHKCKIKTHTCLLEHSYPALWKWDPDPNWIRSVFSNFVDLDPYSEYRSGST